MRKHTAEQINNFLLAAWLLMLFPFGGNNHRQESLDILEKFIAT